jgi:zinc protease
MKNIREDKGYTYGIGSYVSELNNTGYLIIATEVGKDFRDNTIDEVRKEIERLQTELVEEAELDLVRNYLLGQILKSADGPYAMTDLFVGVSNYNLNLEFYNKYIQNVQTITPVEIRDLAIKHLNWDSFSIVTAG